ncbi:MAG: histidine phosphatase family protein [Enterobacterales bacterium]|nr:histidine phosphatase family protein [Enterobacterales bacterium]
MIKISLIRHAQASFGAANYDQLSSLGKQQASAIGSYLLNCNQAFSQVYHGAMWRQRETAELILENARLDLKMQLDTALNEFDSEQLLTYYIPILANTNDEFQQLINNEKPWHSSATNFEKVFRALIHLWHQDADCPFESWADFKNRVLHFLKRIAKQADVSQGQTESIALVTSGGVIGVILQAILDLTVEKLLDINLMIYNASVTEIYCLPKAPSDTDALSQFRLSSFNNISGLLTANKPQWITRK